MGFECWCPGARCMAVLAGVVVGNRAAEVLRVDDCLVRDCSVRGLRDCLIGREIEGRW